MNRVGIVAKLQGLYWAIGAAWPVVHMQSFLLVTGPKEELWLVRCLSLLMIVIGAVLLFAAYKHRITPELKWLSAGGTAVMAFTDFFYVIDGTLPPIYLLDGLAELLLFALWLWAGNHGLVRTFLPPEK